MNAILEYINAHIDVIGPVVAQIISFILFFLILKWALWKPVLKLLDERRDRIQSEFDSIAQTRQEVETLKEDYDKRMSAIEEEAREKVQQSIREGRQLAEEISEKARQESQERLEKSKQIIELEIEKARKQLKEDIIRIAMNTSKLAVREQLDEARHRRLVDEFIQELNTKN